MLSLSLTECVCVYTNKHFSCARAKHVLQMIGTLPDRLSRETLVFL